MKLVAVISVLLVGHLLSAEEAVPVDICELVVNPAAYNHKLVKVLGEVSLGFEDFGLYAKRCGDSPATIWLAFGGDVETPTIYCCGSHSRKPHRNIRVEGFEIPITKDSNFQKFFKYLTAKRTQTPNGDDCYGHECNYFEVTATIIGRFFAGDSGKRAGGKVLYSGYGHLGCCSLLTIQRVADVEARRTRVPEGKFACSKTERTISATETGDGQGCQPDECFPEFLLKDEESKGHGAVAKRLVWTSLPESTSDYEAGFVEFKSSDGLLVYKLELERPWRHDLREGSQEAPWRITKAVREECQAAK